jgi:hypothetical protein
MSEMLIASVTRVILVLSFFLSFPFPFVPLQRRGCLVGGAGD